jgi:hypothetical protein
VPGGLIYHVINRGNARDEIFSKAQDYADFEKDEHDEKPTLCPWPIPRPKNCNPSAKRVD